MLPLSPLLFAAKFLGPTYGIAVSVVAFIGIRIAIQLSRNRNAD